RKRSPEFGAQHFVSKDIIDRFRSLGIYRALVPKEFGGDERSPIDFLLAIEAIAEADGSAGWVASFGCTHTYLAGLPMDVLADIWKKPDDIFAGAMFPLNPAQFDGAQYSVSGRWKWGSGSMFADRVGVGIKPEGDGELPRMAVLNRDQVDVDADSWDVHGMEGSGSFDVVVDSALVPKEYTFIRGGELTPTTPFFNYPTISFATQVLAVTTLGVAKAAMRIFLDSAASRKSPTGAPSIGDRSYVQIAIAKATAKIQSSRLFFYDSIEAAWEKLVTGKTLDADTISMMRLAATNLTRECAEATRMIYEISGMEAAYLDNHLSRCFRDAHMPTQHAFMGEITYQNAGAIMFGKDPLPGYL
ncbi:MAG: acyl-CoA dehydrogenase family protein, partial [Pseudomonadota bacterium]